MTLPTSCGCKRSSYTVVPSRSTGVIVTASGCATSPLTTYSRKDCMGPGILSWRGGCRRFARLFDEAGDRVARQCAFADPVFGPLQVEHDVVGFFARVIGAQ